MAGKLLGVLCPILRGERPQLPVTFIKNFAISSRVAQSSADEPIEIPNPFEKEKRKCILCQLDITPDYKNVRLLSQFQSPYTGRIYGKHITGLCNAKQEQVEKEIRKAHHMAMMPSYHKATDFLDDPKLFSPEKPLRPHKY